MRVPRQRIKIALRLWIPVLVLRIVVAEARSQVGGLSVFSLASTASSASFTVRCALTVCAKCLCLRKTKTTCVWLACENDEKLRSYASYKNTNCGGLIYCLTSCFEWRFRQGNALLLFF